MRVLTSRPLLSVPQVVVLGLAAHRVTKLWMNDTIADPLRKLQERHLPAPGEQIQATETMWQWSDGPGQQPGLKPVTRPIKPPARSMFTTIYDPNDKAKPILYTAPTGTWLGKLLTCASCFSVWATFGVLIASRTRLGRPLVNSMAVAAVAYEVYARDQRRGG